MEIMVVVAAEAAVVDTVAAVMEDGNGQEATVSMLEDLTVVLILVLTVVQ